MWVQHTYSSSAEKSIAHVLGMNLFTVGACAAARIRLSCAAVTSGLGGLKVEIMVWISFADKRFVKSEILW